MADLPAYFGYVVVPPEADVKVAYDGSAPLTIMNVNIAKFDASAGIADGQATAHIAVEPLFRPLVQLGEQTYWKGLRVLPFKISPLTYEPVNRHVTVTSKITVDITFAGQCYEPGQQQVRGEDRHVLQQIVVNLDELAGAGFVTEFEPAELQPIGLGGGAPLGEEAGSCGEYLVIAADGFVDEQEPDGPLFQLIEHLETTHEYDVALAPLSDIPGIGDPCFHSEEALRDFVGLCNPRPSWVLFVGDHNYAGEQCEFKLRSYWASGHFTDHYYCRLGSQVGELPAPYDGAPADLRCGRLPANNNSSLQAMVDKIVQYDSVPALPVRRATLVAGEQWYYALAQGMWTKLIDNG